MLNITLERDAIRVIDHDNDTVTLIVPLSRVFFEVPVEHLTQAQPKTASVELRSDTGYTIHIPIE